MPASGPNFLPWVVAAVLVVCGVLLLWRGAQRRLSRTGRALGRGERGDWAGFAWVSAGLLLNAAADHDASASSSAARCVRAGGARLQRARRAGRPAARARWLRRRRSSASLIAAPVYWMFTKLLAINLPGLTGTRLALSATQRRWTLWNQLLHGFATAATPINLLWALRRLHDRHRRRRAAGHRPGHGGGDAAADHAAGRADRAR